MAQELKTDEGFLSGNVIGSNGIGSRLFDRSVGIVTGLPDLAFTGNCHDENHGPENCRIGAAHRPKKSHAWCVKSLGDTITIDLTSSYIVTGVATQGRGDAAQWITEYSVATSENGIDWTDQGRYIGNFDQNTICKRKFKNPVSASFVKVTPIKSYSHPSMRLDILVYKQ